MPRYLVLVDLKSESEIDAVKSTKPKQEPAKKE
jgi:hypothetical protein